MTPLESGVRDKPKLSLIVTFAVWSGPDDNKTLAPTLDHLKQTCGRAAKKVVMDRAYRGAKIDSEIQETNDPAETQKNEDDADCVGVVPELSRLSVL